MSNPPLASSIANPAMDDLQPIEPVDIAIQHIFETTNSQWINFTQKETCQQLERRTFNRFLIGDGPWTWGLWRHGDDINIFFLTSDNENRWAEVVTEAMGIEVGSKDLKEATKDGKMDLTDERLCRFRDGRRTQYWFLKNANPVRARIVLHYCKISSEWLGSKDLTQVLKNTNDSVIPEWPEGLPEKSYTEIFHKISFLKSMSNDLDDGGLECIRTIWPYARAWAEVNDLWKPDLVNPSTLWSALSAPYTLQRIDEDSTAETMFMDTLGTFASGCAFQRHVSESCRAALHATAKESLLDPETTRTAVRAAKVSLAFSLPRDAPAAPSAPQPAPSVPSVSTARFRDARSALNRLRYDISHAGTEYDVGYVDRFEGMKWMALARWGGRRTEEEDWIPEHRVRRIVRVADGVAVWDREKRVDLTGDV